MKISNVKSEPLDNVFTISTTHLYCYHKVTHKYVTTSSKFDKSMQYFQHGHDVNEPHDNLTSHKNSKFLLVASMAWRPSFILTTKVLYSSKTLFKKSNIKIHLTFTLRSSLFPFVSNNYANLYYSKCFLGEKEK